MGGEVGVACVQGHELGMAGQGRAGQGRAWHVCCDINSSWHDVRQWHSTSCQSTLRLMPVTSLPMHNGHWG